MTESTRSPDGRAHLLALDGLRGIAILLVIVSHYLGAYWRIGSAGWTGVNLFFGLSGFLITGILLDSKGEPHYFRNFYARRTLRIFPLYYAVLFLIFVVAPWIPALNTESFRALASRQIWFWTYTSNYFMGNVGRIGLDPFESDWIGLGHLWSLSVEEQFYLFWPLIVLLTSRRQLIAVTGVCFFGAWLMRMHYAVDTLNVKPYFYTQCRVDDLAVGAFIAVMARSEGGLARLRAWAPGLAIAAAVVLALIAFEVRHFFQLSGVIQRWAYTPFSVFYGCMLVFALTAAPSSLYRRALENRVLRSFGKYSYAIYIFHYALSILFFDRLLPLETMTDLFGSQNVALAIRFVLVAMISWVMGWLSWHGYEKHFLKLKKRFYSASPEITSRS